MKAIIISEKRLEELFELACGRLQNEEVGKIGGDVVVPIKYVVEYLNRLSAAIREDGER